MSGPILLVVSSMYLYVAAEQFTRGKFGLGLAFFGYALSNVGMYYAARQ